MAGCSDSGHPASRSAPESSLRAAAVSWSKAFLTGTLDDIKRVQGPECTSQSASSIDRVTAADYLRRTRAEMQRVFGRPVDAIKIQGVLTRNVTSTSGDAEVQYDLPRELAGNDNWVTYQVHDGQWKVADCHAPIGGNSQAATATSPNPP